MLPWSREPGVADSEADNNSGESEVSIADSQAVPAGPLNANTVVVPRPVRRQRQRRRDQAPGVDPRDDTWRGSAAETDARYPDLRALAA